MTVSVTLFDAFIGREAELDHLVDLRIRKARESRGAVVLLDGEAGIGKTRLIAEFERAVAKERGAFVVVRCEESSVRPYGTLLAILHDLLGRPRLTRRPAIVAAIEALTLAESVIVDDAIEQRRRRIAAFVDAIADAATRIAHLTLVIDDVHWIDLSSLAALQAAAQLAKRTPLLVVVSYRAEDVERDVARSRGISALLRDGADHISLDPLGEAQLLPPLRALLPRTTRENLQRIYDLSEGKPYVAEELARSFLDDDARGEVAPTMSLRDAVLERVSSLDISVRETLGLAAVLGRVVRYDDLAALGCAKSHIVEAIRRARGLQLVGEIEGHGEPAFRFRHSLTQEILYRELPDAERKASHLRIAALLEHSGDERSGEFAYHLSEAGETARAVRAFESSGERASSIAAYDDAARYFEAAADAACSIGETSALARIAVLFVEAVKSSGKHEVLQETLAKWREPLRAAGLSKEAFWLDTHALRILTTYHSHQMPAFWETIRTEIPEGLDAKVRFQYECAAYQVLIFQHRFAEAAEAIARAEWILRPRSPIEMMDLLVSWTTLAFYWHDRPLLGEELARQQLRLAEFAGLSRFVAVTTMNLSVFAQQRGDVPAALVLARDAREQFEALGLKRFLSRVDGIEALYTALLGDFQTARRLLASAHPDVLNDNEWLVTRMQLQRAMGTNERETQELRAALVASLESNLTVAEILATDVPWMLEDKADARDLLRRVLIDNHDTMPIGESWLGIAEFGSDEDLAVLLGTPRDPLADRGLIHNCALLFDAFVARRQMRPLAAKEFALAALPFFETMGSWTLRARALDLSGDRAAAIAYLRSIGAVAEVARYETTAKAGVEPIEAIKLTQREEQVGRLAVVGLTSREIAARLNIGVRTAENHLTNIYDKLDIHSRAELEAYLA